MDERYLKKGKKIISFTPMTFLSAVASIGNEKLANMDGEEIMELMRELPSEIRVVLDEMNMVPDSVAESCITDEDYNSLDQYSQVVVRINGLITRYAKQYKMNPIVPGVGDDLLLGFRDKSEMNPGTVAYLKNFSKTRNYIESAVGLKELYTEVRYLGTCENKQKRRVDRENENNIKLSGNFDIELIGNFKECRLSLADIYILNNKLRAFLTSGRALGGLSAVAIREGFALKATPDIPYAAVAMYYGCVNTDDTFQYDSFKKMTVHDFVLMLGKMACSNRSAVEIMKNSDMCGMNSNEVVTRASAIELAAKNLGPKVAEVFKGIVADCNYAGTKASMFFDDVAAGSKYDTNEIAAYFVAGLLQADELGRARLDEELNMSKAIRLVFAVLESAAKTDIEMTEYVNSDKVAAE